MNAFERSFALALLTINLIVTLYNSRSILTMSGTQVQLDADAAALTAAVGVLQTSIANQGTVITDGIAEIETLISAAGTNGGTIDLAALTAITNATSAIAAASTAIQNSGSALGSAIPAPVVNPGT